MVQSSLHEDIAPSQRQLWDTPAVLRLLFIALATFVLFVPAVTHASTGPTLAVLYFDNNSGDEELDVLSKGFADMLITDLSASKQVTVVEREKLQTLIDEAKLQRTRFFDKKTAVKMGKGLGARYVVSGSFARVKPRMRIEVRLVEVATGKVVLGTRVVGQAGAVFELEQELVKRFLHKLELEFFPDALPPTKVPNLETLLDYSRGLALLDQGQDQQAATTLKSVVQKAPAFGLARLRHATILKKIEAARTKRTKLIKGDSKALYQKARAFLASHRLANLSQQEASHYIAYRVLAGSEILDALRKALVGRKPTRRAIPRKKSKKAMQLMRAFYDNQRLLIKEQRSFEARFRFARADLPADEEKLARELELEFRDGHPEETLLDFVLQGRTPDLGEVGRYYIHPALGDVDTRLRKAAIKLARAMLKGKGASSSPQEIHQSVRVLETLAQWHIQRERIEKGIAEYQKILDGFPKLRRWDYYEKQIKKQLGLDHDHLASRRRRYQKGLSTCKAWDLHVGLKPVLSQRMHFLGLEAFPHTLKEVEKACKKSPELPKMKKSLYKSFFLEAARFNDCQLFDRYMKKWLALGGSTRDAAGYRKNYSSCP